MASSIPTPKIVENKRRRQRSESNDSDGVGAPLTKRVRLGFSFAWTGFCREGVLADRLAGFDSLVLVKPKYGRRREELGAKVMIRMEWGHLLRNE